MAYTPIPIESKTLINKAGLFLSKFDMETELGFDETKEYFSSQDLANRWRACHAYPLNTFQATLRTKLKGYKGSPLVAQRLKRMPTLVDKLKRYPQMKLVTMQDIAGVRGIVEDINDVYSIVDKYINNNNFPHEFVRANDYIHNPRDEDGYRSYHIVYKYSNKTNPQYDGLSVEMQIRTKLQHIWATAVETISAFIGQALKSRKGDKAWIDFFALISSAFAIREGTNPVPRFAHLELNEIYQLIAIQEKELSLLERIRNLRWFVNDMSDKQKHAHHLIINDYREEIILIKSYGANEYSEALEDYNKYENDLDKKNDITLVSAGPIASLRKAYPNLFLDLTEFLDILDEMVAAGKAIEVFKDLS
jgi:putative GTP pyrophosphokinase